MDFAIYVKIQRIAIAIQIKTSEFDKNFLENQFFELFLTSEFFFLQEIFLL